MKIELLISLSILSLVAAGCGAFATAPTPDRGSLAAPAATTTPKSTDSLLATGALNNFFALLNLGRYQEAAAYYGGPFQQLVDDNPSIDPLDYAGLLKNACTFNGYQCLKIRSIVRQEQVAPDTFRFTVEFVNADGTVFVRGPCCGANATQMPPQSQFVFTIKKVGERFLVQDLPVYVP